MDALEKWMNIWFSLYIRFFHKISPQYHTELSQSPLPTVDTALSQSPRSIILRGVTHDPRKSTDIS